MVDEWVFAPLFVVCSRGCCEPGIVAEYLGVPRKTARSLLWALRSARLVRKVGDGFTVDCSRILWVNVVVRGRKRILLYGNGKIVIVYIRKKALRGYSVPHNLLCKVLSTLKEWKVSAAACRRRKTCMRSIASTLNTHVKTVSLALRALEMLGCPGQLCLASCPR